MTKLLLVRTTPKGKRQAAPEKTPSRTVLNGLLQSVDVSPDGYELVPVSGGGNNRGFQIQVAEAAMKLESAYLHAFRAADDLDEAARAGLHPDLAARARTRADSALVAKYCREAVDMLVSAHGTSSLADSNRLQRLWRDIHVASHHAITEWQVNLEIYGKALLGVEPNITPLI